MLIMLIMLMLILLQVGALVDEKKFSHITRNLFLTLSANGRIGDAARVIAAYEGR